MSLVHDKQARLVNALIKANQQRKLKWLAWEQDQSCVYTEIGDKVINLSKQYLNGTESVKVEIYQNGNLADTFIDDDLSSADVEVVHKDNWYVAMVALMEDALRQSTGADEVLDSLLRDLEG